MIRRVFTLALLVLAIPRVSIANSTGIKIRFVITRVGQRPDGARETTSYENAILLAPNEGFTRVLNNYEVTLRPVPISDGINVEFAFKNLSQQPAEEIRGEKLVKLSQGAGVEFPSQNAAAAYTVGFLVTPQDLLRKSAA